MDAEFEGVPVSATNNYTPTTEQVRRSYWYNTSDSYSAALSDAEFDRWLAAERAKAWDEGRESLAADIASPLLDNMTKRQTKNPYRDTCRNAQGIRNATSATSLVTVHWWNGMDEAERIVRGVGNQKVGVTVDDLALDEMDGNQNAEPRWSANRLEEVLREGLPDQNAEPVDTCGICGNPKRTGQNNFGTHQCPPY